jgi:hypothetical protein
MTTLSKINFGIVLQDFIARHILSDHRAATALGVPVFTLKKWTAGLRQPSASAVRLLEIVLILEVLAPTVLQSLMPPVSSPFDNVKRKRGRPRKVA